MLHKTHERDCWPARASRLRSGKEWGSSGKACWVGGKIRKIRTFPLCDILKFASGRLGYRSTAGSQTAVASQIALGGCRSAEPRRWGIPLTESAFRSTRARGENLGLHRPLGECVHCMPLAYRLRETHRFLWERIAGVFYSGKEQRRTLSSCGISSTTGRRGKHSITPNDGVVRRCESNGDTGRSVEAFVEAWVVFKDLF